MGASESTASGPTGPPPLEPLAAAPAAAPAQPQMATVSVSCPPGVGPGQVVRIPYGGAEYDLTVRRRSRVSLLRMQHSHSGRDAAQVPAGVNPGQTFQVRLPVAAPAPAPAGNPYAGAAAYPGLAAAGSAAPMSRRNTQAYQRTAAQDHAAMYPGYNYPGGTVAAVAAVKKPVAARETEGVQLKIDPVFDKASVRSPPRPAGLPQLLALRFPQPRCIVILNGSRKMFCHLVFNWYLLLARWRDDGDRPCSARNTRDVTHRCRRRSSSTRQRAACTSPSRPRGPARSRSTRPPPTPSTAPPTPHSPLALGRRSPARDRRAVYRRASTRLLSRSTRWRWPGCGRRRGAPRATRSCWCWRRRRAHRRRAGWRQCWSTCGSAGQLGRRSCGSGS